jgi:formylglycine-generating enzyme required for sulfatase activity
MLTLPQACLSLAAAGMFLIVDCSAAEAPGLSTLCSGIEITIYGVQQCLRPKESFRDCDSCPEMIVVPPGAFVMGSPNEEDQRSSEEGPQHKVEIGIWMAVGKYEVTFAEWDACSAEGGCRHQPRDPGWGRGRRPVVNVSWNDITSEFLPWLSSKSGQHYRLLTEAEWEYAARSGTTTPFSTGTTISADQANFDGTNTYAGSKKGPYRQRTLEAGSFPPNAFGLYDMHGNVWEWVEDCFTGSYAAAAIDGKPALGDPRCTRVLRGGSWIDSPRALRSAYRSHISPDARFIYRGFRIARTLQ